ncbi:MAG: dNTP triphosphohydrolase [Chloroflexi bacterium]|nr:dNTP triphosphohydrolase [Chloroflexota bacterium]
MYTAALRRLAGVTQVVAAGEGHVFHNRLTHTLEVAQVAGRLAEKLSKEQSELAETLGGINADVVEAAALAHDLGHPPFGHVAEETLDKCLQAHALDGFEGNPQSFRVVTRLESRHRDFSGLNLCRATLNAILKYPWHRKTGGGKKQRKYGAYHSEGDEFAWARELGPASEVKSVEAELMDWADDIAYSVHDMEDFYRAGLIPLERLTEDGEAQAFLKEVFERWAQEGDPVSNEVQKELERTFDGLREFITALVVEPYEGTSSQRWALRSLTATLIARYVGAIGLAEPAADAEPRVEIHERAQAEVRMLKQLTWHYVIHNPALAAQQHGKRKVIRDLFEIFDSAAQKATPQEIAIFPIRHRESLQKVKAESAEPEQDCARIAADLIADMTERQALDMHQRLTGNFLGSVMDVIVK